MRRRIARVVLAVTLSAIGCAAQPRIAVRSQVAGVPAPLHRVKVYAPLVTGDVWNPVSQTMFDAFKASLELRLQLCRVSAEISREPPPEAGVAPAGPEPVASLGIEIAGKQIIDVHHSMNGAEYAVTYDGVLYLGLALTDGHAPAPVWVARTGFAFANAQLYSRIEIAEVDARSLARAIVGRTWAAPRIGARAI